MNNKLFSTLGIYKKNNLFPNDPSDIDELKRLFINIPTDLTEEQKQNIINEQKIFREKNIDNTRERRWKFMEPFIDSDEKMQQAEAVFNIPDELTNLFLNHVKRNKSVYNRLDRNSIDNLKNKIDFTNFNNPTELERLKNERAILNNDIIIIKAKNDYIKNFLNYVSQPIGRKRQLGLYSLHNGIDDLTQEFIYKQNGKRL